MATTIFTRYITGARLAEANAAALGALSQELEAMVEAGEPFARIKARQEIKLRCGKCRRTLDVVKNAGERLMTDSTATKYRREGEPGPRPSVTKLAVVDPDPLLTTERYVYRCHRRCCDVATRQPTQHVVMVDHLVPAYIRAVRAGVDSLHLPLGGS